MHKTGSHRLEAYLDRLFGFAVSLAGDREMARDLVQDCAVKALSARRVPRDEPAYRAWLFRVLRNGFIDGLRRDRRRPETVELDGEEAPLPQGREEVALWRCDQELVNRIAVKLAMDRLNDRDREIIALIDVAGLTYGEAAQVLAIPVGTVMSRISRARRALLTVLGESNVRVLPRRASGGSAS